MKNNRGTSPIIVRESIDKQTHYTLFINADGSQTLNILLTNGEKLFVNDWQSGRFGITLDDADEATPTTPTTPSPVTSDHDYKRVTGGATDGQGGNDVLVGSAAEETLLGGAGDALIKQTTWTAYNAWVLSQSCKAPSMRLCQPVPVARKVSTTVGDSRMVMRSLVAASCVPRARRASLVCSVSGNAEKVLAARASAAVHSGLSASINSGLSLRFINCHLSFISLSKTDYTNTQLGFYKYQRMYALPQITQSPQSHFAVFLPQILREQSGFKLKINHLFERQTTHFNIEDIFSGVESDLHTSDCMYKIIKSQAANDDEWRVAA